MLCALGHMNVLRDKEMIGVDIWLEGGSMTSVMWADHILCTKNYNKDASRVSPLGGAGQPGSLSQPLTAAIHQPLENIQALPEGGEEGVVAQYAERRQRAVAVPGCHLGGASPVLWWLAGILLCNWLPAALFSGCRWRCWLRTGRWRQSGGRASTTAIRAVAGRLCRLCRCVCVAAFVSTGAVMSSLEGAVEVDADSIAGDSWVLISQSENKWGVVTKANSALAYTQAALGLAEKHHVRWEGEVVVVLQWVAAEKLRGLGHAVTAWLPGEKTRGQAKVKWTFWPDHPEYSCFH